MPAALAFRRTRVRPRAVTARRRWITAYSVVIYLIATASAFYTDRASRHPAPCRPLPANPNDAETPAGRSRRMELVRQLQKSFYSGSSGTGPLEGTVLRDVPLWRVQWTELPGYNVVLNCHVPHYTHMFMGVLNGPRPWYFGHLLLPGGSENLDNPKYRLGAPDSKAATTGTLMRVSDYRQLGDGRLLLVCQALERFAVVDVTQHLPYGVATVEILPDRELIDAHYLGAAERTSAGSGGGGSWGAAACAAAAEAVHFHPFEFRSVSVDECGAGDGSGVSPLANYDTQGVPDAPPDTAAALEGYLAEGDGAGARPPGVIAGKDAAAASRIEQELWISIDSFLRLLEHVNPDPSSRIPVPAQILGLLPTGIDWPEGFRLLSYAEKLRDEGAFVGTGSKSPFIVVDEAAPAFYPASRRTQRFSFAVWTLLGSLLPMDNRQDVLEMSSMSERLESAKERFDCLNESFRKSIQERR